MRYFPDSAATRTMTTDELRDRFLFADLFRDGQTTLEITDLDRLVVGGAVPLDKPLTLGAPAELRAGFFTERRELGVLNIGGSGDVTVDGRKYPMEKRDVLYVGRSCRDVKFSSRHAKCAA